MAEPNLDRLKSHRDKWKSESRAFWGRATLGAALLLASIMFQFGYLWVAIPGVTLELGQGARRFYFLLNVLSWFLWLLLCFKFVDLLRHRLPNDLEKEIHENDLPNPFFNAFGVPPTHFPLRPIGQLMYLIFPVYAVVLGLALGAATWHVWDCRSVKTNRSPKSRGP